MGALQTRPARMADTSTIASFIRRKLARSLSLTVAKTGREKRQREFRDSSWLDQLAKGFPRFLMPLDQLANWADRVRDVLRTHDFRHIQTLEPSSKPSVSIYRKQSGDSTQPFGTSDSRSPVVSPPKGHFQSPGNVPPLFFKPRFLERQFLLVS